MQNTYLPLLTYAHADGAAGSVVIPALAKSMPKIDQGGRRYTLHLRPGLEYSDGTPVRASDFKSSVERLFRINSSGSIFYTHIVGAERFAKTKRGGIAGIATDDATGTIVIRLDQPLGVFTNELASLFAALLPPGTPDRNLIRDPAARHRALRDRRERTGQGLALPAQPRLGARQRRGDARPSQRPRRRDRSQSRRQPVDPGERDRAGQGRLDEKPAAAGPLRRSQGEIPRDPVPPRPPDQQLLLLDEHPAGRRSTTSASGAPSTTRSRRGRWNGSTPGR